MKSKNIFYGKSSKVSLGQRPWFILTIFILFNAFVGFSLIHIFDYDPSKSLTWRLASAHKLPPEARYSPLPSILSQIWQYLFGKGQVSALSFYFFFYGIAIFLIFNITQRLFEDSKVSTLTVYLTMFSPYIAWSVYVGPEVALDIFSISLLLFFASKIYVKGFNLKYLVAFALAGSLATSVREPSLAVFSALLLFLCFRGRLTRSQLLLGSVVFLVGISPLLIWNYSQTQSLTLSTRLGENLYLGNHPYYLTGHPKYDIDDFLEPRIHQEVPFPEKQSSINKDAVYRQLAWTNVKERPAEALERSFLKGIWWVGLSRIPGSDSSAYLHPENNLIVLEGETSLLKDLLYILHRTLVLLAFLVYWKEPGFRWEKALFLLIPTIAVMPIAMATFPDTRFRLAYDPYFHMLAAAGLAMLTLRIAQEKTFWLNRNSKK